MVDRICGLIVEGKSLRTIARLPGMPDASVVCDWLQRHPEFTERYARAKTEQAEAFVEEMIDIADAEPERIVVTVGEGDKASTSTRIDSAWVQLQKTRLDARKWIAAKMKPQKYGEKLELGGVVRAHVTLDELELEQRRKDGDA